MNDLRRLEHDESSEEKSFVVTYCAISITISSYIIQRWLLQRQSLTNYKRVIRRKRFYSLWTAFFTHPPRRILSQDDSNQPPEWTHFLTRGPWSGLPLLLYNCHLLYACRELEVNHRHGSYTLLLCFITLLSASLELATLHYILKSIIPKLVEQMQMDRADAGRNAALVKTSPIGTLIGTVSPLITIYGRTFDVPLQVFPIFRNPRILDTQFTSFLAILIILTMLSKGGIIPPHSTIVGVIVGHFWKYIHFLADWYWGSLAFGVVLMMTCISIYERNRHWLPCIDFFQWTDGTFLKVVGDQLQGSEGDSDSDSADSDDEAAFPSQDDDEIYGAYPTEDLESQLQLSEPLRRSTIRSRRNL